METREDIKLLAYERLNEAKILLENGKVDGAFYLAGYSVELILKWKVCENFDIDNLFATQSNILIEGVKALKDVAKTHSLYTLLLLSGLRRKFDAEKDDNQMLFNANSLLMSCWSENSRYAPCGSNETKNVQKMLDILDNENGFLSWIEKS
jgi:hypothetical protein